MRYERMGVPPLNDGAVHAAIKFVLSILKLPPCRVVVTTVAAVSPVTVKFSGLLGIKNVVAEAIAGNVEVEPGVAFGVDLFTE